MFVYRERIIVSNILDTDTLTKKVKTYKNKIRILNNFCVNLAKSRQKSDSMTLCNDLQVQLAFSEINKDRG